MPSKRYNTALAFINAFETLDGDTFHSLAALNYTHIFAPARANGPAPRDRETFAGHISGLKSILEGFPVVPKEVIENVGENQVVVWATSETLFREDVMDDGLNKEQWAYKGEYVFILTMDESGEKIVKVFEFLDSKGTEELRGLIARAKKNKEKRDSS